MSRAPRRIGLKDLAAELHLSVTTVSRALAGYPDVGSETRGRVRSLAARRGYVPSRVGRAMVSGDTGLIGVVLPPAESRLSSKSTFADVFLGPLMAGLCQRLQEAGRQLVITTQRTRHVAALVRTIDRCQADGLIVADRTFVHDDRVAHLTERNVPFVVHGRVMGDPSSYAWSDTDGASAFGDATRRLIALGHRHFGLLTFEPSLMFARVRRDGLLAGLRAHGLRLRADAACTVTRSDDKSVERACATLLNLTPRPTAVLCVTDALAIKLVQMAAERSIAVPGELSVIGFDNVPASAYARPGISTFDQHIRQSACDIADLMICQLSDPTTSSGSRMIRPAFVPRRSHGPAPIAA
ncbi:MAG: LacI family DNA-binding transcriptional regulator [Pseudomonadota bacterium]